MDLRFYSLSGALQLISADYLRVCWEEAWADEGECALYFPPGHAVGEFAEQGKTLIVEYGERQAIICGYSFAEDCLILRAKPLLTLLSRRLVPGENTLLSGEPTALISGLLAAYAPYISVTAEKTAGVRSVLFKKAVTLLEAAKQLLSGTGLGMKIVFDKASAGYTLQLLAGKEKALRFSSGNRNLSGIRCSSDFCTVQNAGYYTEYFAEPVLWNGTTTVLSDYDAANYMKQYKAEADAKIGDMAVSAGEYVYCDTKDGKLQTAKEPQVSRTRYMCLEENPALVFEADLRGTEQAQTEEILSLRQYKTESWQAFPCTDALETGDLVWVEKELGLEKGLKRLQVQRIRTDTQSPMPKIVLN